MPRAPVRLYPTDLEVTVSITLPPAGVALLVFTGTKPNRVSVASLDRDGEPVAGIQYTHPTTDGVQDTTTVVLQAQGYAAAHEAHTAIARAAQACIDAGLRVDFAPAQYGVARLVRRRS